MKVVILAGGLGTRLSEETEKRPKPLIDIGEYPIIWHIMKSFEYYGFNEFFIALGYKGEMVKKFFMDYLHFQSDVTIDFPRGDINKHDQEIEQWRVNLVDTGLGTNTGGRLKRLQPLLCEETFMLTYGDGVSTVDPEALLALHRSEGRSATVTGVRPPSRFGGLVLNGNRVLEFTEKPQIGEGWINGGFMVFEPEVFEYIEGDGSSLEADVLEDLARDGQLTAYKHEGFWQCMDTLRDVNLLKEMWASGRAPWKIWD